MIVSLPFGRDTLTADLRGLRCAHLTPSGPRARPVPELVARALDRPLAGPSLRDMARGRRDAVVLVPDATRKAALPDVLPAVLSRLADAGIEQERVTLLIACGTHPAVSGDRLAALLGDTGRARVAQHDAHDEAVLREAGTLSTGLRVRLNRALLEADLAVAISTVQHHYFAGFGGGPKLVFPGVAGYDEIQANHARVIDLAAGRREPRCEPGVIEDNPVATEIAAAAALRPPDLALVMVAGREGGFAWAESGPLDVVYPAACARVRDWFEVEAGPFSRMLVSAGGHPSDATLIQAHKALDAAARFAATGAEVVFVAACEDGPGSPAMAPFLEDPRPQAILARLAERYVQYGHTTLRLVEKTARLRVLARTRLDAALIERLGMRAVDDLQTVVDGWRDTVAGESVGVMIGGAVVPRNG